GDQPDFVSIPDRPNGVQHDPSLLIFFDEQMQGTNSEIEAIQHGVAGEKDANENKPDGIEIQGIEAHWLTLGSASLPAGFKSLSSGPWRILSSSKYTNTANSSKYTTVNRMIEDRTALACTTLDSPWDVRNNPCTIHGCRPTSAANHPA